MTMIVLKTDKFFLCVFVKIVQTEDNVVKKILVNVDS